VSGIQAGNYGQPPTAPIVIQPGIRGIVGLLDGNIQGSDDFKNVAGPEKGETARHQSTIGTCYVIMHGEALRAGFPIPCPVLNDVEGVTPQLDNRLDRGEGFFTGIVANAGTPVYGATWRLRYFLPTIPTRPITPPQNPTFDN
jgi:hypothetical protein